MRTIRGFPHIGRGIPGLVLVACATLLIDASTQAAGAGRHDTARTSRTLNADYHIDAHAAHTLNGTDTAHLHLVHQDETVVFEEGTATGGMPGHMKAELTIGSTFTGNCTVYARGGSITGHGTAAPHGSGRYQSFHGSLLITGGTGNYAHIHGRAGLYGTFDRRTFALVLQTTGNLSY